MTADTVNGSILSDDPTHAKHGKPARHPVQSEVTGLIQREVITDVLVLVHWEIWVVCSYLDRT